MAETSVASVHLVFWASIFLFLKLNFSCDCQLCFFSWNDYFYWLRIQNGKHTKHEKLIEFSCVGLVQWKWVCHFLSFCTEGVRRLPAWSPMDLLSHDQYWNCFGLIMFELPWIGCSGVLCLFTDHPFVDYAIGFWNFGNSRKVWINLEVA